MIPVALPALHSCDPTTFDNIITYIYIIESISIRSRRLPRRPPSLLGRLLLPLLAQLLLPPPDPLPPPPPRPVLPDPLEPQQHPHLLDMRRGVVPDLRPPPRLQLGDLTAHQPPPLVLAEDPLEHLLRDRLAVPLPQRRQPPR